MVYFPRLVKSGEGGKKKISLDSFDLELIRNKVKEFYTVRKEIPTVMKLLQILRQDIDFNGGRESLRLILKEIGFEYVKCQSKRTILMERHDIKLHRFKFLERMKENQEAEEHKKLDMIMAKKAVNKKQLRNQLSQEINFLKSVFSVMSIPIQMKGENDDNMDYEIVNDRQNNNEEQEAPKRARSIAELEEKLNKIKSQHKFNLKNKLVKKSLSSKLNKKIKKKERLNKKNMKPVGNATPLTSDHTSVDNDKVEKTEKKPNLNPKPVFNQDGKLVFSKFEFANMGQKERINKAEKNPKKILENLKQQEQKFRQLEEKDESGRVKELKEKVAWKTVLQKAEGQKIKDDPTLLKKSIKKMEQKKKHSQKKWDNRVKSVEQKKEERQKKRKENISKKKKEKKSKIVKAAVKRGRVVI